MTDANEATLHAYYDGELGWWAQRRFEAHLRRSPELRAELQAIRSLGSALRMAEESSLAHGPEPDLWPAIAAELPNTRTLGAMESDSAAGSWAGWFTWRPLATGALAVAMAAAFFALQPGSPAQPAGAGGPMTATVRYLDTGGRSVVLDGGEDFTIIWLTPGDAV